MRILCANWQAADDAELEREHYPDIDFVLARSTNEKSADLDPELCKSVDAVINYSPTHNVAAPPTAFPKARIAVRSGVGFDNID
ncbi:MAG: C-terminal binding protein, partial [Mesorhizobium sp.]|nr:C-terminal binding protein [Mesorhizobium sp.]